MILNNFQFQLMNNPYEDWDEYDWQDHISKVSHQDFLKTEKGRQWQREKQKEKRKMYQKENQIRIKNLE